jgi:hypothetical protein
MMDRIVRKFFVMTIASAAVALLLPAAVPAQNSGLWTAIDPSDLKLDDNPKLPGGPAMVLDYWHEINERNEDDAQRRKNLEDWLKAILPDNSQCTLTSSDGWTKSDEPVTATLHVQTHGYASQVGQRLLLRLGYFKTSENKPLFSSAHRTHPIYFRYPMQSYDVVRITPPKGFAVEATPAALSLKSGAANFDLKAEKFDQALQITRSFVLDANYSPLTSIGR